MNLTHKSDLISHNCKFISHNSNLMTHNCKFVSANSEKKNKNCQFVSHNSTKKISELLVWIRQFWEKINTFEFISHNSMKKKVRVTRLYLKIKNVIATFYLKMQTFFRLYISQFWEKNSEMWDKKVSITFFMFIQWQKWASIIYILEEVYTKYTYIQNEINNIFSTLMFSLSTIFWMYSTASSGFNWTG